MVLDRMMRAAQRLSVLVLFLFSALEAAATRPNVLFLVVDDLRPKLGCYGESNMVTPNIDNLAAHSVRFDQAFVQQSLCAPSRGSFLTGRRPDTTRVFDLKTYFRTVAGNFTTLPQHFKDNGYVTQSVGKVFHPGQASGGNDDYPYSWTYEPYHPPALKDDGKKVCPDSKGKLHTNVVCPVNVTKMKDKTLADIQSADFAVSFLRNMTDRRDQPFFLAVGFHKPHMPFMFPEEFLELYPMSKIEPAPDSFIPMYMPSVAWNPFGCIRHWDDIKQFKLSFPFGVIPDQYQLKLRQAYSAATSYTDTQVGRVLAALDQAGLANNTIISFLGDHGWSLGEHQEWCKFSNFEIATRIPLMFYVPGVTSAKSQPGKTFPFVNPLDDLKDSTDSRGFRNNTQDDANERQDKSDGDWAVKMQSAEYSSDGLVEAVDMYSTLCELAGLPVPPTCPQDSLQTKFCTEGSSLVPLILNATRPDADSANNVTWKGAVFSQYPRPSYYPRWGSDTPRLAYITIMGYTMRTADHRYTEWVSYDPKTFTADWSHVWARELYVHASDPLEDWNMADASSHGPLVTQLSQQLRAGWRKALPSQLPVNVPT